MAYGYPAFKHRDAYRNRIYYESQMLSKRLKSIQASFDLDKEGEQAYKKYRKHTFKGQPTKWKKRYDEKSEKVDAEYLYHLKKSVSRFI